MGKLIVELLFTESYNKNWKVLNKIGKKPVAQKFCVLKEHTVNF